MSNHDLFELFPSSLPSLSYIACHSPCRFSRLDADLLKPDARMSVHERLGGARKRRHGKASSPPPPTVPLTTASGSRDHYTRKVVRYDDRSSDDDRKEKNGSRLTEGKTFVTHQVSPPADKEAHSRKKKKTPLVLKTIVRRERHEPDVTHRDKRDRHSRDRHSRDRVSNKKPTGKVVALVVNTIQVTMIFSKLSFL